MKPFTFAFWPLALFSSQAAALPHIDPETPIPLNAFRMRDIGGRDPHMGIDPETIRKYASMVPESPGLGKRVVDFDPKEQLVDGECDPKRDSCSW